jgi:hypothetical protein
MELMLLYYVSMVLLFLFHLLPFLSNFGLSRFSCPGLSLFCFGTRGEVRLGEGVELLEEEERAGEEEWGGEWRAGLGERMLGGGRSRRTRSAGFSLYSLCRSRR